MQTNDIGFRHPELFGSMGSFTSTMFHEEYDSLGYERPWPKVMANPQQFMKNYRVFFCSATPQEDHIPYFMKDAQIMCDAGIEGNMPGYRRTLHDKRFYPLVQLPYRLARLCSDAVPELTRKGGLRMEFTKELLANKIFESTDLSFDFIPRGRRELKGFDPMFERTAQLQSDGSYLLRFNAPNANEIKVVPWFGDPTPDGYAPWRDEPIFGSKDENGVFTVVLPFEENKTGPRNLDIYIDGTFVVWPYLPIYWSGGLQWNYVEVPDNDMEFCYIQDVPHGIVGHNYYWSDATNNWERCLVYTPPGYMSGTESYPVLYLQHGGGENETVWTSCGRVNFIMDNLIAEGKCKAVYHCDEQHDDPVQL